MNKIKEVEFRITDEFIVPKIVKKIKEHICQANIYASDDYVDGYEDGCNAILDIVKSFDKSKA
jgi:hypothetical protein